MPTCCANEESKYPDFVKGLHVLLKSSADWFSWEWELLLLTWNDICTARRNDLCMKQSMVLKRLGKVQACTKPRWAGLGTLNTDFRSVSPHFVALFLGEEIWATYLVWEGPAEPILLKSGEQCRVRPPESHGLPGGELRLEPKFWWEYTVRLSAYFGSQSYYVLVSYWCGFLKTCLSWFCATLYTSKCRHLFSSSKRWKFKLFALVFRCHYFFVTPTLNILLSIQGHMAGLFCPQGISPRCWNVFPPSVVNSTVRESGLTLPAITRPTSST